MKYIQKNREPSALIEHRSKEYACYDNIPKDTKDEIRKSLLAEQGHVCCYCMKRIHMEDMKIEHWKPQGYVELSLQYSNMLGACNGNEGNPRQLQCCDTYKGEKELFINPLDKCCETFIKFRDDGTIYSDDPRVNHDLKEILNLNQQTLKENRKEVIDCIVEYLLREYPTGQWPKAKIQEVINQWNRRDAQGRYREYYGVALYRLQRWLMKATS